MSITRAGFDVATALLIWLLAVATLDAAWLIVTAFLDTVEPAATDKDSLTSGRMRMGIEKIFRGAIRRSLLDIVPPGRGILEMSVEILPEGVRRELHCARKQSRILMFFAHENRATSKRRGFCI
jgi:hypothetical protein